jgi:hypothetical protein
MPHGTSSHQLAQIGLLPCTTKLSARHLAPESVAIAHYFRANAWANSEQMSRSSKRLRGRTGGCNQWLRHRSSGPIDAGAPPRWL